MTIAPVFSPTSLAFTCFWLDDLLANDLDILMHYGTDEKTPTSAAFFYAAARAYRDATEPSNLARRALASVAMAFEEGNPAKDVTGPDAGEERAKQFLYPSEFLRVVSCERIPLRWRRAIALAVYFYPRHGELRALRWEDVDLEHGTVHLHQSFERRSRQVTSTKSGKGRRFSFEPALLPLLSVMHAEAGGVGDVAPIPNRMASRLRGWVTTAGVTRRELTDETSKTTKPLGWHDLRATGLTWMAVRGDDPLKIMSRAGHEDFATTQIYIRTAEALRVGFGEPFPTLPAALFGPVIGEFAAPAGPPSGPPTRQTPKKAGKTERDTGFEPATSSLGSWHSTN